MRIKVERAVKPFRRKLRGELRMGRCKLRVFGSKGAWHLGIQRGETIHRYSNPAVPYITQVTAILAGVRKFGVKASLYREKAVA